jgi:hypothetical protein
VRRGSTPGRSRSACSNPSPANAEAGPARAIATAAEDHDAALVVVGSRGRSQLEAAVLGSVSYGVLHLSRRPTLVVDAPPEEAATR